MPTFSTPEPITVTIWIPAGDVRVTATDRADTVVDVQPSDAGQDADVRAAEQTKVEYTDGHLSIRAPRPGVRGLFGRGAQIEVTVAVPAGSSITSEAMAGGFAASGRLGECRIKTSAGDVRIDDADQIDVNAGAGEISAGRISGNAEITTGSGKVRLRQVGGSAQIKNSNGDNWVGSVAGDLRVSTANGAITVEHALGDVTATTAMGAVRIGEVVRGSVSLKTAMGDLEVGVRRGTAAWLDAQTHYGHVRNRLEPTAAPGAGEASVEVRARTAYGDIVIHHTEGAVA
jgi:Putative adhesin